jgi:methane/ammonia monooxygenase subunit C
MFSRGIFCLLSWIFCYGTAIYWGASYFTEQDGTWHMTVIRDTDFTRLPSMPRGEDLQHG